MMTMGWAGTAQAEQFLSIPTSRAFPVTCRWTCPGTSGGMYYHNATDYGTPTSSEIRAAADGRVVYLKDGLAPRQRVRDYQYGNWVKLQHLNGYETRYAHLLPNTIAVQRGQNVVAGQLLGLSDNTGQSTGPHLHFEVRDPQGRRVNPYGNPPNYAGGCGPNALWMTCPPTPAPPPDSDGDGFTVAQGDCDDTNHDVYPGAEETCNGIDDDCNGTPDDPWRIGLAQDVGNMCTVSTDACTNVGIWVCASNGQTTVCSAAPPIPRSERCDGRDNDCDGETDENWRIGLSIDIGQPCSIAWGSGACTTITAGAWMCAPDGIAVVCDASEPAGGARFEAEEICNRIDDDCDGIIDDVSPEDFAYDEAHCGGCDGPACEAGAACMEGRCYTCTSGRDLCYEYCIANVCLYCNASDCISPLSDCMDFVRIEDFTDIELFNRLCDVGCAGL